MTIDKGDRIAFIDSTHITLGGLDMHHWHRLGSFIILICLLFACDQAHAGRFSISLGYGLKQIDGTDSDPDGDFDITAPAVSHIELTGPS